MRLVHIIPVRRVSESRCPVKWVRHTPLALSLEALPTCAFPGCLGADNEKKFGLKGEELIFTQDRLRAYNKP